MPNVTKSRLTTVAKTGRLTEMSDRSIESTLLNYLSSIAKKARFHKKFFQIVNKIKQYCLFYAYCA